MATVVSPDDPCAAVSQFPATFRPYGNKTGIPLEVQAVLWHYDLRQAEVDILDEEGYVRLKDFRSANPFGSDRQKQLYKASFEGKIKQALFREKMADAFARLSQVDPFAAFIHLSLSSVASADASSKLSTAGKTSSSSKQLRFSSSSGASTSASASTASASAVDPAIRKQKLSKAEAAIISYTDSDESVVDEDADEASGAETSGDAAERSTVSKKPLSLHSLFDVVKSEVCVFYRFYCQTVCEYFRRSNRSLLI